MVDPADYERTVEAAKNGGFSLEERRRLAAHRFDPVRVAVAQRIHTDSRAKVNIWLSFLPVIFILYKSQISRWIPLGYGKWTCTNWILEKLLLSLSTKILWNNSI